MVFYLVFRQCLEGCVEIDNAEPAMQSLGKEALKSELPSPKKPNLSYLHLNCHHLFVGKLGPVTGKMTTWLIFNKRN